MINKLSFRVSPVFLLFLFSFFGAKSQEIKLLKGEILTDSILAANINIINISLEKGTTSDQFGNFSIFAKVNDSILFSSVQFQNKTIRIKEEMFNSGSIEIKLYQATNELDEVEISDIKLSGFLQQDAGRIKFFDRQQFGIPYEHEVITQTERNIYTATHSAGGIPLEALINTINGKIKRLKKAKANDDLTKFAIQGLNIMGEEYFKEELKIPEIEILNFLYFCARQVQYRILLKSVNQLQLMAFFEAQKPDFFKIRELDD